MNTENLRLFVDVARMGSFSAVARGRLLDPSSVSRAMGQLEDELGVQLFQRTTRRVSLSEAGQQLLTRVEGLVDELDHAVEEARAAVGEPAGNIRMTASASFGLARIVPLLPDLRRLYPKLGIEFLLTDQNLDLVSDRIDLAIRLGPRTPTTHGRARLLATRYRVVASPAYLRASAPITEPAQITQHPCLLFALPDFRSRWLFRDAQKSLSKVAVRGEVVISNAIGLHRCAIAGMGLALLPEWLVQADLASGTLQAVLPDYEVTATDFDTAAWALYPAKSFVPRKVRVVIDFLRQRLAAETA